MRVFTHLENSVLEFWILVMCFVCISCNSPYNRKKEEKQALPILLVLLT
jgi:hypothetical protein